MGGCILFLLALIAALPLYTMWAHNAFERKQRKEKEIWPAEYQRLEKKEFEQGLVVRLIAGLFYIFGFVTALLCVRGELF